MSGENGMGRIGFALLAVVGIVGGFVVLVVAPELVKSSPATDFPITLLLIPVIACVILFTYFWAQSNQGE